MIIAIFVIAYPIERWVNKPKYIPVRSALPYLFVGIFVFLIGLSMTYMSITNFETFGWWPAYLLYGSVLGTYTAFVGRIVFAATFKFKKSNHYLAIVILGLTAIGAFVYFQRYFLLLTGN